MYYSIKSALSHNCLWNFILGGRGRGKSYSAKKTAIDDFKKNGTQFIWLRRYKTEFKKIKTFFKALESLYPADKFEIKGGSFYINGEIAGYYIPLSTAITEKSNEYPNVKYIFFDEFIIDVGAYHYLPDEVNAFLEFYETVARMRDVIVFFLANNISFINPYFLHFDIREPAEGKEFYKPRKDILLQMVQGEEFAEKKRKTRFGQLVAGTEYGFYNIENMSLRDETSFIAGKTPKSEYYFSMAYKGDMFGVYIDYTYGQITVSNSYNPSFPQIYSFTTPDHKENTLLINMRDNKIQTFIKQFRLGNVRFENPQIKGKIMTFFKNVTRGVR